MNLSLTCSHVIIMKHNNRNICRQSRSGTELGLNLCRFWVIPFNMFIKFKDRLIMRERKFQAIALFDELHRYCYWWNLDWGKLSPYNLRSSSVVPFDIAAVEKVGQSLSWGVAIEFKQQSLCWWWWWWCCCCWWCWWLWWCTTCTCTCTSCCCCCCCHCSIFHNLSKVRKVFADNSNVGYAYKFSKLQQTYIYTFT